MMKQDEEQVEYVEQQPQQQGGNSGFYQPTIMPSEKADLYDKINPQDIVDYLKFRLMGYEWDRHQQDWIKPKWKKGLTELGASELTTLMLPVSSKNVIISKLDDSEIRQRTKNIHKTAMMMCIKNWKEYGIRGSDEIQLVSQIVVSNTFITLKQPENAGAREFLGKSSSEQKSIIEDNKPKGIIGGIFRR